MRESNELFTLCKQVYEATGWANGGFLYEFSMNAASGSNVVFPAGRTPNAYPYDNTVYPLYTSDYLLEKLPYKIGKANSAIWLRLGKTRNSFTVCYMGSDLVCIYDFEADTPLKALLRLTLKLHEDKIL